LTRGLKVLLLQAFAFGIGDYFFWLLLVSALCFGLERVVPWRKQQAALRQGFAQDVFWLVFHGHVLGVLTALASAALAPHLSFPLYAKVKEAAAAAMLVRSLPLPVQFLVLLVVKDFLEWCTHNLLHRVGFLWQFHKVHHSIRELDFLGNFRFHWAEVTVYWFVTSLPIAALGVIDARVWMTLAVFSTLIGHLNHSNLPISWGPLRYVLNSPKMHVWHHARLDGGAAGHNFGVVLSVWDWLFRTARVPDGQPARLGFEGDETFPSGLVGRLAWPLGALRRRVKGSSA
jgi:sterol desaturase/sphingolipid hydroxylase (fatty acid hydroxylase superfamily)